MARCLRLADGPDEVHLRSLGRSLVKAAQKGPMNSHRFYTVPDRETETDMRPAVAAAIAALANEAAE
jgi:hypothetical protein